MDNETKDETLQNVLTEKDVCDLLGMNKNQVGDLRRKKGLPFVKLSDRSRLYFESDIVEFFKGQRVVLNKAD
jgi:hypothetical protein